jgi:alpha-galactosidase
MADALRASGRPIVFSMCEWGTAKPWLWAKTTGNLWRTTGDIWDSFGTKDKAHDWAHTVLEIVDLNEPLWPFAGPGHWNDADMLEVGNGGMTPTEYRSHFSLWAMMASPLMAGNDVAHMDQSTRSILLNSEVIAVDQDRLGVQGHRVWKDRNSEVWVKPLAGGGRALLLLNRGEHPVSIRATADQLNYPPRLRARVRDLWAHRNLQRWKGTIEAAVEPHGVALFRIDP